MQSSLFPSFCFCLLSGAFCHIIRDISEWEQGWNRGADDWANAATGAAAIPKEEAESVKATWSTQVAAVAKAIVPAARTAAAELTEEAKANAAWGPAAEAWTSATQYWDAAVQWIEYSASVGWGAQAAQAVAAALRSTAYGAAAIGSEGVAAKWQQAETAWETTAGALVAREASAQTPEPQLVPQEALAQKSSQTFPNVISITTLALTGLLAGCGITYAMLQFRYRASTMHESLLAPIAEW